MKTKQDATRRKNETMRQRVAKWQALAEAVSMLLQEGGTAEAAAAAAGSNCHK